MGVGVRLLLATGLGLGLLGAGSGSDFFLAVTIGVKLFGCLNRMSLRASFVAFRDAGCGDIFAVARFFGLGGIFFTRHFHSANYQFKIRAHARLFLSLVLVDWPCRCPGDPDRNAVRSIRNR